LLDFVLAMFRHGPVMWPNQALRVVI